MGRRPKPKPETTSAPAAGRPIRPDDLGDHGDEFWDETAAIVAERQSLTQADRRALELTARAYQEYRECLAVIRKAGRSYEASTVKGDSQMIRPRPEAAQADAAWKRVFRGLIEFGLTPASRSRVTGSEPAPKDDFEEFLNHGKALSQG